MSRLYFVILTALILGNPSAAHAYLDPGAGGMLLQLLLGGAAGLLVVLKLYWHRIKKSAGRLFFRKPPGSKRKR